MNETIQTLLERRSCKKYLSTPVPTELVDEVVKAGTYAPTGRNRQPGKILVVTDTRVRNELRKLNASIMGMDESFDPFYGAPVVAVVLADPTVSTYLYDGSLVLGNMMNAAYSVGVDSCWIHRAREEFASEEGKALLKKWGIEGTYVGVGHLILGYRDCEYPETRPRKDIYIYRI